jgi:phytoene dehydrogenase-like protein
LAQTTERAVVIGSGPNGLAAAITLAKLGCRVVVYEAEDEVGGGMRSAELTLPGFMHDVCASVHPMALSSEFFKQLKLEEHGLHWVHPQAPLAHPFDDGAAILLTRSLEETAEQFGEDGPRVHRLLMPFVDRWRELSSEILRPAHLPRYPWLLARFGRHASFPALAVARREFKTEKAQAVFAGLAAHSAMALSAWGSAAFGILLWATCHAVGWPFAEGGSQSIARSLTACLEHLGGKVVTRARVNSLRDFPPETLVMCDVTPRQFGELSDSRMSEREQQQLKKFPYGPGVFKIDWALDGAIPWNASECRKAGTVHLGGTLEEIAESESAAWSSVPAEKPFVLLTQPSLFDSTRAPSVKHTAWAYCHVPHASTLNMVEAIERQVERFAIGFRQRIIARSVMSPSDLEAHNSNLIGGDISGGAVSFNRLVRKSFSSSYRTSIPGVFLCSASTPPGPGVHGLCGYFSAKFAYRR